MRSLWLIIGVFSLSTLSVALDVPPLPADQEWFTERCEDGNFFSSAWGDITRKDPAILNQWDAMVRSKFYDAKTRTVRIPSPLPRIVNCWVRYPIKLRRSDRDPVVSVDGLRTVILHDQWSVNGESGYEAGMKVHYQLKRTKKLVTFEDASCAQFDAYGNVIFYQPTRRQEEVTVISRVIEGVVRCRDSDMCARLRLLDELTAFDPRKGEPQAPIQPTVPAPIPIPEGELPKEKPTPAVREAKFASRTVRSEKPADYPANDETRRGVIHVSTKDADKISN